MMGAFLGGFLCAILRACTVHSDVVTMIGRQHGISLCFCRFCTLWERFGARGTCESFFEKMGFCFPALSLAGLTYVVVILQRVWLLRCY